VRRGFKTEAKSLALELRAEIGLDAHAPFDPYAFASEYGIPVVRVVGCHGDASSAMNARNAAAACAGTTPFPSARSCSAQDTPGTPVTHPSGSIISHSTNRADSGGAPLRLRSSASGAALPTACSARAMASR
jgi:hypothetical protein